MIEKLDQQKLLALLQEKQAPFFSKEALQLYIPPQVGTYVNDPSPHDAGEMVKTWVCKGNAKCLLLLGDSGAGKTLFGQWLVEEGFKKADVIGRRIPLFIPLSTQRDPSQGLIDQYLTSKEHGMGITDENQREFIKQQPLLLILDGYDEIRTKNNIKINLYRSNELWKLPNAKIIISCRSQALAAVHNYRTLFYPCNPLDQLLDDQLQEYFIHPFTPEQIDAYLKKYVQHNQETLKLFFFQGTQKPLPAIPKNSASTNRMPMEEMVEAQVTQALQPLLQSPEQIAAQLSENPEQLFQALAQTLQQINQVTADLQKKRDENEYIQSSLLSSTQTVTTATKENTQGVIDWAQWETYRRYIDKIIGLQDMLRCPFVLCLVAQVLPEIISQYRDQQLVEQLRLARINFYDYFVSQWLIRQKEKLVKANHIDKNSPIEKYAMEYSKNLALAMLQVGVISIEYHPVSTANFLQQYGLFGDNTPSDKLADKNDQSRWEKFFDEEDILVGQKKIKKSLIRSCCPLIKLGEYHYAFLHKSLLDYFAARELFEGTMMDASLALGYALNEKLLTPKSEVLKFMAERVAQDETLKARLFEIIEESKHEARIQIAAANAMTILNYAGVSFSGHDFRRIRIPQADLSQAILDSCDLREADLRNVSLYGTWLQNAKLGNALIENVQLGEFPFLEVDMTVDTICYSPDGKWLATGGYDSWGGGGVIQLWDMVTQKCVDTLKGINKVKSVAFSPDSKFLVSGHVSKKVRIWDIATKKCVSTLEGHTGEVSSVAFNRDGKLIASGSHDKTIIVWDVTTKAVLTVFKGHTDKVTSIAFGRMSYLQSEFLVSGSDDNTMRWWNIGLKIGMGKLSGHISSVTSVAYHPNGMILASGSADNTIRLWNLATVNTAYSRSESVLNAKSILLTGHSHIVTHIAFSPNGKLLASVCADNTVRLWDVNTQRVLSILGGHGHLVTSCAFSPDGQYLASGSFDKTVRLWDVPLQRDVATLTGYVSTLSSVACTKDGQWLAAGYNDNTIGLWSTKQRNALATLKINKSEETVFGIASLAFNKTGKILASSSDNSFIYLWSIPSGKCISVLIGHKHGVTCVAFSPEDHYLASGGSDSTLRFWDIASGKCVFMLTGHQASVTSIAFSPDGKFLVSGSDDNSIRLWDIQSKKCIRTLMHPALGLDIFLLKFQHITCVAFSSDGKYMASASTDYSIGFWKITNGTVLAFPFLLKGHEAEVTKISFRPDGKMLVSVGRDGSLRFWDVATRNTLYSTSLNYRTAKLSWQSNGQQSYLLYVASGKAIYCFAINATGSALNPVLINCFGHHSGLSSQNLDLGGVVGLDAKSGHVLKQRKAIGKPSQKQTDAVLKARNETMPYKASLHTVFGGQYLITPQSATVTMARKKTGKGSIHAFLVLEYIESNYYKIIRADFVLDQKQKHIQGLFASGQGLVEVCVKSLEDMQILAGECVYKCWKITESQAKDLLTHLEGDRVKSIAYLNLGNSPLYDVIHSGQEKHSCLTWCEAHLSRIGIDVTQQQSWLDAIVVHPKYHLPTKEEELDSKQNCLIM